MIFFIAAQPYRLAYSMFMVSPHGAATLPFQDYGMEWVAQFLYPINGNYICR